MAVQFVAASLLTGVAANPPSFSLQLPQSAVNDIIIIKVMSKNIVEASNEINTPSGYTEVGTKLEVDSAVTPADDMRTALFWKRAVVGDSKASVTISRNGTDTLGLYAVAHIWRWAVTSGSPFGATGITTLGSATAGDIIGFGAHDPTESDVHVIYDGWKADDATTALAAFTNDSTSFGVKDDQETTTGSDCTSGIWSADRNGNPLGAINATCSGTDGSYIGYVYSLLPGTVIAQPNRLQTQTGPICAM